MSSNHLMWGVELMVFGFVVYCLSSMYAHGVVAVPPREQCDDYYFYTLTPFPSMKSSPKAFDAFVLNVFVFFHDTCYALMAMMAHVPFKDTNLGRAWHVAFENTTMYPPWVTNFVGGPEEASKQQMVHCATYVLSQSLPYLLYFQVVGWIVAAVF